MKKKTKLKKILMTRKSLSDKASKAALQRRKKADIKKDRKDRRQKDNADFALTTNDGDADTGLSAKRAF